MAGVLSIPLAASASAPQYGSLNVLPGQGFGLGDTTFVSAEQSDGKIIVGGMLSNYDDGTAHPISGIARLNSDGTFDTSFNPSGTGLVGQGVSVNTIVVLSSGKILVGGNFAGYDDGSTHYVNGIIRLNADGSFDPTFNTSGTGITGYQVQTIAVQSDGKILVGGEFTDYDDGSPHTVGNIFRLNSDGTFDSSFSPGTGFDGAVASIAVQPDGKVVVGGSFTTYFDGPSHPTGNIARLNTNGTFDSGFYAGGGFSGSFSRGSSSNVFSLSLLSSGDVLVGGDFTNYSDSTYHQIAGLARLNSSGALDTSFNSGNGFDKQVSTVIVNNDGSYLVGGAFTSFHDGSPHAVGGIAQLTNTGSFDPRFSPGAGFTGSGVIGMTVLRNGLISVSGAFSSYAGSASHSVGNYAQLFGTAFTSFFVPRTQSLSGTVGTPITPTVAFPAAGMPNGPITYSVSPALPAGLSIDPSTGVISGTPTVAVSGTYTITATNSASPPLSTTATITFSISGSGSSSAGSSSGVSALATSGTELAGPLGLSAIALGSIGGLLLLARRKPVA